MHDKFTERVRKIIFLAREEARRLQHESIGTEHLLLALIRDGAGIATTALTNLGLDLEAICRAVENMVARPAAETVPIVDEVPFASGAKRVLELSVDEARRLRHNYVGTEHLLLGLIREGDGVAAKVLMDMGADRKKVRDEILRLVGGPPRPGQPEEQEQADTPSLNQYGRNLTQLARDGALDPIFGREQEIERVIRILCRRMRNNPILVGEPGVGKTAIVHGLATRIVEGAVPARLGGRELVTLDLLRVVAGTRYRGQFEERLKRLLDEIRESGAIISFDAPHSILGVGAGEDPSAAALRPALLRGEFQCIGVATPDQYHEYIEIDGVLERRFQKVLIKPPADADVILILRGLRAKYEAHHRVTYADEALTTAAELVRLYLPDRSPLVAAIDVIDEAGARAGLSMSTPPVELRQLEREILETASRKEAAIRSQDFPSAVALRDKERELRQEYYKLKKTWDESASTRRQEITARDIQIVVSEFTGIPVTSIAARTDIPPTPMDA